jgi:chemotaxis protein methyltransferase CheR
MQDTTFQQIAALALRETGQDLSPAKTYLIEARLAAISRRESFASLDDLAHCLKSRPNPRFEAEIAAALTPKKTVFFDDRDQIDRIVSHALPELLKASNTGRLRIWCAGVSTGQEAYSLAMRLSELDESPLRQADIELVATDVSGQAIGAAQLGLFGHFDVQKGLSIHRLLAHFERQTSGDWQISKTLREQIQFRRHNLFDPAGPLGRFDLILCRNVLPAMSQDKQIEAVARLNDHLYPNGLLFLGKDESLTGLSEDLEPSRGVRGAWCHSQTVRKTAAA